MALNCDIQISREEILEKIIKREGEKGYLKMLSVLQFERECWEVLDTFPFLKINAEKVEEKIGEKTVFFFLTHNFIAQNLHRDDVKSKVLSSMIGDGIDFGIRPESKLIPNGVVNPMAHTFIDFNGSMNLVSRPFVALGTNLVVIDEQNISQYVQLGRLDSTIKPGHAVVVSDEYRFRPVLEMSDYFSNFFNTNQMKKINLEEKSELEDALNVLFESNLDVETDLVIAHKRKKNEQVEFNHAPIRTSRYGILKYRDENIPYVEFNGAMLHFEKAKAELQILSESQTFEGKIRATVYFICALQAVVEGLSLFYKKKAFGSSKHGNDETSTEALVRAVNKLSKVKGKVFTESSEEYKLIERLRKFRNFFLHIGISDLGVNVETGLPDEFQPWLEYRYAKDKFVEMKKIFKHIFEITGERHLFHLGEVRHYDIPALDE